MELGSMEGWKLAGHETSMEVGPRSQRARKPRAGPGLDPKSTGSPGRFGGQIALMAAWGGLGEGRARAGAGLNGKAG